MARGKYQDESKTVEVEITDLHLVLIVLGLAAFALAGVFMVTRNPETLRQLAEIAKSKGAVLVEHGRRLLA
jgi:hypothetical protein